MFAYGLLSVVLVLYLVEVGLKEWEVGLLLTLTLAGDTAISLWLTTTADRLGRRRTLILGAILMVLAGIVFVSTGSFLLLVIAATVGAIIGDGLSFWLGHRYHREILSLWPLNRYPELIARSEAFFSRHGDKSVFLARFIAVVRAFVPLVAGILGMSPRQFYAANILSALAWAPAHVFPGVLLGMAVSLAGVSAGQRTLLLVAGLIAITAAVWAMRFYLSRHPLPTKLPALVGRAVMTDPQITRVEPKVSTA
jgi:membrane protein DedA with SNARE-associated domain